MRLVTCKNNVKFIRTKKEDNEVSQNALLLYDAVMVLSEILIWLLSNASKYIFESLHSAYKLMWMMFHIKIVRYHQNLHNNISYVSLANILHVDQMG